MGRERVVLVSLQENLSQPPLGLGYLASFYEKYKRESDFDITIQIRKLHTSVKDIAEGLQGAEIVGITCLTGDYNKVLALCQEVKSRCKAPIILGGQHISALPNTLPSCADIAVIGEGEQTFLELLELYASCGSFSRARLSKVKGIAYHDEGGTKVTERRELIEPLDKIPFPARNLLPFRAFGRTGLGADYKRKGTHLLTSRGCPYKCVFCSSSWFWQRARFFSAEYVVAEIKEIMARYRAEVLHIADDLCAANIPRFREIAERVESEGINRRVEFRMQMRANLMDDEICRLMKRMNVTLLMFGFESGCEKTLRYLKKGTATVADNKRAIELCRQYGIRCDGSFMIGTPGETKEDILETVSFINENFLADTRSPNSSVGIALATPLPGTELWNHAKSRGLVDDYMNWDRLARIEPIWAGRSQNFKDWVVVSDQLTKEELWELTGDFLQQMENRTFSQYASGFRLSLLGMYIRDFLDRPADFSYKARKTFFHYLRQKTKFR